MGFLDRFRKKPEPVAPPAQAATPAHQPTAAPPRVVELPVEELKARIDRGEAPILLDVREPWETSAVRLPGARLIPMNTVPARLAELDPDAEIVVYCHHGMRSWNVAAFLAQRGFTKVSNLTGGIDAWARRVDPAMRRY